MTRIFRILFLLVVIIFTGNNAYAATEASSEAIEPTVVAPGGLTERERAALDRQYKYEVRGKDRLVLPTAASAATAGYAGPAPSVMESPEEEKLHRYFGTAVDLYDSGRLEEAAEIFKYLHEAYPDDDYVRSYLSRVQKELSSQKKVWKADEKQLAASLKKKKIKDLLQDGIDNYNNREYDTALINFADVLSLDPGNSTAKSYMEKLKQFYSREFKAEEIAQNWAREKATGEKTPPSDLITDKAGDEMARKADELLDAKSGLSENAAEKTMDEAEMKDVVLYKKAEDMLQHIEFGSRVDEIIVAARMDEAKSNQLTLGAGDTVRITVLNHPELSGDAVLRSNGEIALPLCNDVVMAGGLTVEELAQKVNIALGRYITSPHVSISVTSFKSQVFYVMDEVSCTPYPITRPDLTLRDALFLADWGDNRALGRVLVIKASKYHPVVKKVDAFDLIYRGNLKNDIRISNGDIIYVPMTIASKTTKVIYDTLAPFRAVRAARDEWLSQKWTIRGWRNYPVVPLNKAESADKEQDWTPGGGGGGGGFGGAGY